MSESQIRTSLWNNEVPHLNSNSPMYIENKSMLEQENYSLSLNQLSELVLRTPNEILLLYEKYDFLSIINKKDAKQDLLSHAIIALGKACFSDLHKNLSNLLLSISPNVNNIVISIQQYLVSLRRQDTVEKCHLDSLFYLAIFLRNFQSNLPSSSFDFIAMILPQITLTCKKHFKDQEELGIVVSEKLKEIDDELQIFMKHFSVFEIKNATENEKLHLQEPPENFRSIPVIPTADDILLPCSFLRTNITIGKYKNAEHYLDVQFRLLREDYIKPVRDGIAEYLCLKKNKESFKNCKSVQVYTNVRIVKKHFEKGNLIHIVKFNSRNFGSINWENSKRLLTGSLLCLSSNDFRSILFATVVCRDVNDLKKGFLHIRFEEINGDVLSLNPLIDFVMIETSAYFVSYCHNLKALQTLNGDLLPMKRYIIDVEKTINCPQYLLHATAFDMKPLLISFEEKYIEQHFDSTEYQYPSNVIDSAEYIIDGQKTINFPQYFLCTTDFYMRPLLILLDEKYIKQHFDSTEYQYPSNVIDSAEFIRVRDDNRWPSAAEFNLDESQLNALKSAVTKEFAIIQGPPGTGKTYVGLRVVQLLLCNLTRWFKPTTNSLPILIVCYTNHALDQFLEGVLLFTQKIVRIGGRGTNEKVAEFQINKLKYSSDTSKELKDEIYETKFEIQTIIRKINRIAKNIEESTTYLIRESDIAGSIPSAHLASLKRGDFRLHDKLRNGKNTIEDWLKAVSIDESSSKEEKLTENFNNTVSVTNKEVENENEADVEFIENQRNIDFYDFEGLEELEELEEDDWWSQRKSKLNLKYIREMLEQKISLKKHQAMKIKNIWMLDIRVRWQLYKFWLEMFIEEQQKEYLELQDKLKVAYKKQSDLYAEQDFSVIKGSHIIGMTTTGAAKYRHIIEKMKPAILIVEEAAEILESHVITSLAPETQHVILIGDQQQLRPSPSVYTLAVKYGMNVSLFERMIKNGVDYCRLTVQHRMRPEIASLIVPHIYPDLKNHDVVNKFDNIKGVHKNVFFISHNFNELHVDNSKTKVNEHEAKFLIELCKYLIFQGYKPSQITVLTMYSGQLLALKRLATDQVKGVHFTVVDNYQGEENDIVLISFVRSNDEGEVGFLKVPNRVCVALSRAKKGLYCIGNFELLAQKSDLWKNIVETLARNQSIGPSLKLVCHNHPHVWSEVANDTDFSAFPEGGCGARCDYRRSCGHSCPLLCHPYDPAHESILCEKPCNTICKAGHQCPKRCFEECGSCAVIVDKTLTLCGHTVPVPCGLDELEIECSMPCIKSCDKGHKCSRKCFQDCKPCRFNIDKTLKCGHTIPVACGLDESEIKCSEPCMKSCEEGHKCSKKCFRDCKPCRVIIDKTLKCGHTVPASCRLSEWQIKCREPCIKSCDNGHKCQKKCFEKCGCEILVKKTLKNCNHTLKVCCKFSNLPDTTFICENQCSKTCNEGHRCARKCCEECGPCTFLVNKTLSLCGHTVEVPCSTKENKIICDKKCDKILPCGHKCSNKCNEPCVLQCIQGKEIESPICGHVLEVECGFTESFEDLQEICSKPCGKVLPCGHVCKGTCGSCYQGRLHIECQEACERVLICGHKCNSKCSKSCPPCEKPCENRCSHRKCPRKCGSPCIKCFKKCSWFCSHKKCTRYCYEICDREPCNEPCMKVFPCSHPCVGFCGEPCPKDCQICNGKVFNKEYSRSETEEYGFYVYLEDCKHLFKEDDLNKWLTSETQGMQKIEMKTCPKCNIVIRRNVRFNKLIKTCIANIEKIKLITMYDREENLKILRSLSEQPQLSYIKNNHNYEPIVEVITSENVGSVQDLLSIGNIINIVGEIESRRDSFSMFVLPPNLVHYDQFCRIWLSEFISNNFLSISEYQLVQMLDEVYRLNLIGLLLKIVSLKFLLSSSPDFENCVKCVINFKPFTADDIKKFETAFQSMIKNFVDDSWCIPIKNTTGLTVVNMSGNWYQFPNGNISCSVNDDMFVKHGYECSKSENSNQINFFSVSSIVSESNLLSKIELNSNMPDELQSLCSSSLLEIGQHKFERVNLQSLLQKKLQNSTESYQNSTEQKTAKLQLCELESKGKVNQSKEMNYIIMSEEESFLNRGNDSDLLNEAIATGAVPKYTRVYNDSHHREQNKCHYLFNNNFRNTSQNLTKDNAYHEGSNKKRNNAQSNLIASEESSTSKSNHGHNPYHSSNTRSESQKPSFSVDSISNSSKYRKDNEENSIYPKHVSVKSSHVRTSEITTKISLRSKRQTVTLQSLFPANK